MQTYKGADCWAEWLIAQSRTDHIYDIIYYLYDFNPGHDGDFVGFTLTDIPDDLLETQHLHHSKNHKPGVLSFRDAPVILLDNYQLTDYLEAARNVGVTRDEVGNAYLVLLFTPVVYLDDDEDLFEFGDDLED
jgi:hypothetical protein